MRTDHCDSRHAAGFDRCRHVTIIGMCASCEIACKLTKYVAARHLQSTMQGSREAVLWCTPPAIIACDAQTWRAMQHADRYGQCPVSRALSIQQKSKKRKEANQHPNPTLGEQLHLGLHGLQAGVWRMRRLLRPRALPQYAARSLQAGRIAEVASSSHAMRRQRPDGSLRRQVGGEVGRVRSI